MADISISIAYVRAIVKHAQRQGHNVSTLLESAGIPARLLEVDQARVTAEKYSHLITLTTTDMQDEMMGYSSHRMRPGMWFMTCHSVIHSETLGGALRRFCKFYSLFPWGLKPYLQRDGEIVLFGLRPFDDSFDHEFFAHELVLFLLHRFSSWLIREHIPMITVDFALPPPDHLVELRHSFLGNPIRFEKPTTGIRFHHHFLDRRIKQDVQTLNRFLRAGHHDMLVNQYANVSWTTKVREIAAPDLTAMPEFEAVADALRIHPQTLRRRLASEGLTYNELKSNIRRDAAVYLLGKRDLSIEEIAARIGFSQASAFTRAFKAWTGLPPQQFRELR